jgi:hypothetical protein
MTAHYIVDCEMRRNRNWSPRKEIDEIKHHAKRKKIIHIFSFDDKNDVLKYGDNDRKYFSADWRGNSVDEDDSQQT